MKQIAQNILLIMLDLTLVILLAASCNNGSGTSHDNELCSDFASITFGEYILENNTWGSGSLSNYTQCIFWDNNNTYFPLGWLWDWPEGSGGNVKAYPELIYGYKPWSSYSTSDNLPLQVNSVSSITVSYSISTSANGTYNLAIEFWLTSNEIPTEDEITTEVMIWLDTVGMIPAGTFQSDETIDEEGYAFYAGEVDTGEWLYIAFVKDTPEFQGQTSIDAFIDFLLATDNPLTSLPYISNTDYIASIEIGNELIVGSGTTTFTSYSIDFD
jgi:hypothetical protein